MVIRPGRAFIVGFCGAVLAVSLNTSSADDLRMGPIWDRFPLTLSNGERTEAVGPLFYRERDEARWTWAIPPLFSYAHYPDLDTKEFDFVYPVLTYDRYGPQYRFQLFQLLSFAGGPMPGEDFRKRITLYPVFFYQRSSNSNENYTAYGPFYGHLKHRFFRDEINYVMFPLYSKTRRKDVVTRNYVYPIFHLRHGDGLEGWQFWPLAGYEEKGVTTRTNLFGDVVAIPGHRSSFALWPIYFNQINGIGTPDLGREYGAIPVFSIQRSPGRDSTTVIWPFFSRVDDRDKKYREWDAPWPLIVFARGPGKYTTRVFPIYSHAYTTNLQSDFWLWPVYKYNRGHSQGFDQRRTRILFYVYSHLSEKNLDTGAVRKRIDCWPLFKYKQDLNGNTRLQVLALIESFLPGSHKIERDYSPLWSIWRSEHNAKTGAASQSLLWNLYRHDKQPDSTKVSMLFGLYQSEKSARTTTKKFLFIPIVRQVRAPKAPNS
jgi:hypothetical protein